MAEIVFTAPRRVYQHKRTPSVQRTEASGYSLSEPAGLAKTRTGGLATLFPGHPFPRKGFIYPGVTEPNNKAKRITLSLFLPFASIRKGLKAFLNSYLYNHGRLVDAMYNDCDQTPYLHYQYYSEFGKALWYFIYLFLKRLGIEDQIAYRTGLQVATMVEYDDAYLHRGADIMHESSKENFLQNPRKEILRLVEIYKKRELAFSSEDDLAHAGARIINVARILSLLLYIPWIKNAFRFAIENINFEYFTLDQWDKYWMLNRADYNCFGREFKDRKQEAVQLMVDYAKQTNPGKEVKIVEKENGNIDIVTSDPQ